MAQIREITIDGKAALRCALISKLGLQDYAYIMKHYNDAMISEDEKFKTCFNGFYKIRCGENWRKNFYNVFMKKRDLAVQKNQLVSFEEILKEISIDTRVAASYASKMLATIHPNMPIWDSHVLKRLNLSLEGKNKQEKERNANKVYAEIVAEYRRYMVTKEAKDNIKIFDSVLPDYKWINDIKKIDYFLWMS